VLADRDFLFDNNHPVKRCLRGKMPMVVDFAHGTDYSTQVAIICKADFAASGRREHTRGQVKGWKLSPSDMRLGQPG
jgi:hypothetical protein